jgi:hypothetical protein
MLRMTKYRFRNRFNKNYSVSGGNLLYQSKKVVAEDSIPQVLRDLYSDSKVARNGVASFHSRIKDFVHGNPNLKLKSF